MNDVRQWVRVAALSAALTVGAAPAYAQRVGETPIRVYENGVWHFGFAPGITVTENTVEAPEGPVRLITVTTTSPQTGNRSSTSFLTFTWYAAPLQTEACAGKAAVDCAADVTVSGVQAAFPDGSATVASSGTGRLGGADGVTRQFELRHGGASAQVRVLAVAHDGGVLVLHDQRNPADSLEFGRLDAVLATFAWGAAPAEPTP